MVKSDQKIGSKTETLSVTKKLNVIKRKRSPEHECYYLRPKSCEPEKAFPEIDEMISV